MKSKGKSTKQVLEKIRSLPGELSAVYTELFQAIDEEDEPYSLRLMQWIYFAMIALSLDQLRFAITVDEGLTIQLIQQYKDKVDFVETDEDMEKRVQDLSRGLANIVEYKGERIARFVHRSVNNFLAEKCFELLGMFQDKHRSGSLQGYGHFRLSRSCLKILAVEELLGSDLTEVVSECPLVRYAAAYWMRHAEIVEKEDLPQTDLFSFFRPPSSLLQGWIRLNDYDPILRPFRIRNSLGLNEDTTFLYIVSSYNLPSTLEQSLLQDIKIDSLDIHNRTPISHAAENGHEALVKLLVQRYEANPCIPDMDGRNSLTYAAQNGHEAIVRYLSERPDVQADSKDYEGRTPLSWAAYNGFEAVVRYLVARPDVEADSRDQIGRTPLSHAAERGNEEVVRYLAEQPDVEADSRDDKGRTPLSYFAGSGVLILSFDNTDAVVRYLVARPDIEADSRDNKGQTPLSYAAERGKEEAVRYLAARPDVEADSKDNEGRTPLAFAMHRNHETTTTFLASLPDVDHDIRIDSFKFGPTCSELRRKRQLKETLEHLRMPLYFK